MVNFFKIVINNSNYFLQTGLTICEGEDGTESSNGDVLFFPDMIRYRFILNSHTLVGYFWILICLLFIHQILFAYFLAVA